MWEQSHGTGEQCRGKSQRCWCCVGIPGVENEKETEEAVVRLSQCRRQAGQSCPGKQCLQGSGGPKQLAELREGFYSASFLPLSFCSLLRFHASLLEAQRLGNL